VFYLKAADGEKSDPKVEFFHKSFGEFLCADRMRETLVKWTKIEDSRRKTYCVSDPAMHKQVYDLLGFGSLTPEIVEYLMALLKQDQPEENALDYWRNLTERLKEFYWDWSGGRWIEARDEPDEPLPLRQARWFQKRSIRLGLREVDIHAGLNVMILLFQIHAYAQSRDDLKEHISFHPCGQPNTEEFDDTRLLRVIGYSDCLEVRYFRSVVGGFLSHVDLRAAYLLSANLLSANLSHANLSHANLLNTFFLNANLSNTNLHSADLRNAFLRTTNLSGADLSDTNLSGADLSNANLSNTNLSNADLRRTNLRCTNLRNADLLNVNCDSETQWLNAIGLHKAVNVPEALKQLPQFAAAAVLSQGFELVQQGNVEAAITAYQTAQQMAPNETISATSWNKLCWYGSLYDRAEQVLFAGDRAVELEPDNPEWRDSRGFAKALAWDYPGALKDFQAVLEGKVFRYSEEKRQQRQRWVEALQQGKNPFSPGEVEALRKEIGIKK
jgi:tetratricopeptide (TPR) repeat protein